MIRYKFVSPAGWFGRRAALFLALLAPWPVQADNTLEIIPLEPAFYPVAFPEFVSLTVRRSDPVTVSETITFDSGNEEVFDLQPPYSVTFLAGETSRTLSLRLKGYGTAGLIARSSTNPDRDLMTAVVRVQRPVSLSVAPDPAFIALSVTSRVAVTVSRQSVNPGQLNSPLTVNLTSSSTNTFTVTPSVITFPATGASLQTASVTLEGAMAGEEQLTMAAAGYATNTSSVIVTDDPAFSLAFDRDPVWSVLAAGGVSTVLLTRSSTIPDQLLTPLTVDLSSSDTGLFTPASSTVTFPPATGLVQSVVVTVAGLRPGEAVLVARDASGVYGLASTTTRVREETLRWLSADPDPIEIILSGSTLLHVDIIREGLLAGDLGASLNAQLISTEPGVLGFSEDIITFPGSSSATLQSVPVTALGRTAGESTLVILPADPVFMTEPVPVRVFEREFIAFSQNPIYIVTGRVANVTLRRAGFTDTELEAIISTAGSTRYLVSGPDGIFGAAATVRFPVGVTTVNLQMLGVAPTAPGLDRITAVAPGFPLAEAEVFVVDDRDSNGDGIPDWWYIDEGEDPRGPTVAFEDWDNDGIINLWEFRMGGDPREPYSLDPSGRLDDGEVDTDGDQLINREETGLLGTDPTLADTDDDGITDGQETLDGTNPLSSVSPYIMRAMRFLPGGAGEVRLPGVVDEVTGSRFDLSEFTVELWVNPEDLPGLGVRHALLRKVVDSGVLTGVTSYELGIKNGGLPYARLQGRAMAQVVEVEGAQVLPRDAWTRLAFRYQDGNLTLLVNGVPVRSTFSGLIPATGPGNLILGGNGFVGDLREARLWRGGRSNLNLAEYSASTLFFNTDTARPGVLELVGDDGHLRSITTTTNAIDGSLVDELTDWTLEAWVRSSGGGGEILARYNGNQPDDGDVNYELRIGADGRLEAGFAIQYTAVTVNSDGSVTREQVINREINDLTSAQRINDGQWHHVAYVRSDRGAFLYVDGLLDSTQSGLLIPVPPANTFFENVRVRSLPGPIVAGRNLTGTMDEIRLWNRALSAAEISRGRVENLSGGESGLVSYFNFDLHEGITVSERSLLRDRSDEYGVLVAGAQISSGIIQPVTGSFRLNPIRALRLENLVAYLSADDGGGSVEDFVYDLDHRYAGIRNASVMVEPVDDQQVAPIDSNGDGISDAWYTRYGFDPLGPSIAYQDTDQDGLHNLAEFWADTNPRNWDTAGDGFSDYDSRSTPLARSWGEIFTDGDGMEDAWEQQYPTQLSPLTFEAHRDSDGDGWSNYAEFMNDTDPADAMSMPRPIVPIRLMYNGVNRQGSVVINLYSRQSMDGMPDAIGTVGPSATIALSTIATAENSGTTQSGTLSAVPVVPGTLELRVGSLVFLDQGNGTLRSEDVLPVRFGNIDYASGEWSVNTAPAFISAGTPIRAGWSQFTGVSSFPFEGSFSLLTGQLREGPALIHAFIDANGNGTWDEFEPAGVAQEQPVQVSWGQVPLIQIGLTDTLPGYHRFSWEAVPGQERYTVDVIRVSSPGAPRLFRKIISGRTYFHEGDYRDAGFIGLDAGGSVAPAFNWFVNDETGSFLMNVPAVPSTPVHQAPVGQVVFARNELSWTMSEDAVRAHIEIRSGSGNGPVVFDRVIPAPFRNRDGIYRYDLPIYGGDQLLPNGVYSWRIRAENPYASSSWSSFRDFVVNVSDTPPMAYAISGTVHYFGQALANRIYVQAFESPGFSGRPLAQVTLSRPGSFSLRGLRPGSYYLRAYLDQNGDGQCNVWESQGHLKDYLFGSDYELKRLEVPRSHTGQQLVLRDRDTNNNRIADAWEFATFGNLTSAGAGVYLSISPSSRAYGQASVSNCVIAISANASWSATRSFEHDWIIIEEPSSGYGGANLRYRLTANNSTRSRSGLITVSSGGVTREHHITQTGLGSTPPPDPDITTGRRPVITWPAIEGATWYRMLVMRNDDLHLREWVQGAASWTPPPAGLPGGNYQVWVQPWGPQIRFGPWSLVREFSIPVRAPGILSLIDPQGAQFNVNLVYRWMKDPDATWYRLWIGRNGGGVFHDEWYALSGADQAQVSVNGHPGDAFTWYVRPWGPDGFGPWSGPGRFTTPNPNPGIPVLLMPSGAVFSSPVVFSWEPSIQTERYRLTVRRNGVTVIDQWLSGTSWIYPGIFDSGSYAWWVGASNSATARTVWSMSKSFVVP